MASYVDEIDTEESAIEQELGLLQAIYVNELEVQNGNSNEPVTLSVTLHPSTADNADLQYVCLTLILTLTPEYPDEVPDIAIKNPRGISDEQLNSISSQLQQLASEQKGSAMLYELIEVAKEALTHNNTPYGQCVICMEDFKEGEAFTKTACYHHFHSDCLARYIQHALEEQQDQEEKAKQNGNPKGKDKQEVVCAVCREPIAYDLQQLCSASSRKSANVKYKPDHDMQQLQKKMAALYQKQKEKGGIIDVEAESNKFLIDISVTPTLPMSTVIGSANSDEKAKQTGLQEKLDKNDKKTSDNPRDRQSQPRYNNSDRRSADGEKRRGGRGGGGSYDKSYGERRGGRGRVGSRTSGGRYPDREYYKSDCSNWREGDRRPNRRDDNGRRESKHGTDAKDGERSSYKERSDWKDGDRRPNRQNERESKNTSEMKDRDNFSDRDSATERPNRRDLDANGTASLKEGKIDERSSAKNGDKIERTDAQREMKGKDPSERSADKSRYKGDRSSSGRPSNASGGRPDRREYRQERNQDPSGRSDGDSRRSSGQADRGSSGRPSSASGGRPDRRENRYQENDRPRTSNARDGHGRNRDSDRASDGRREDRNQERNDRPKSSHPRNDQGRNRDRDSPFSGRPDRRENRTDRYQERNDTVGQGRNRESEREDRPSKKYSPRYERSSASKNEPMPSREDRKDSGRGQRRDGPRNDAERREKRSDGDRRWRDGSPRSNPRQRRDKDHPKMKMDSNSDIPRNQESRSYVEIRNARPEKNDKSYSDFKHTEKTDRSRDHSKSGNKRYDKTRTDDARRGEESQDKDRSNNDDKVEVDSDRSLIDRITSSKGGQRSRNYDRSSKSSGRGQGQHHKDYAARQEHTSSDRETKQTKPLSGFKPVANEVKAPPGFAPVASESKPEKVKPPPGFEDFR